MAKKTDGTKPGYKTTEFWIAMITAFATLANQSGLLGALVLPIEGIATIGGIVGSYILSRGMAKKS